MRAALEQGGQYTTESRAVRGDGAVAWVVSRGRVVRDASGEPVRILGTVLDVTDARQQSDQRLSALQRATAVSQVAAELANAARFEDLADVVLRGAKVLGAQSSALAIYASEGGPLRLHMTRGLADEVQEHVDYPVEGIELELDEAQPTQYSAIRGERVLLGTQAEMLDRFPATREGSEVLGVRAIAALPLRVEGKILGSFLAIWTVEHPFAEDDVELLEALAAQIALSVSRLRADDERATAVAAMAEANQRLQLLADAGRVLSGSLDITQQIGQLAELVVPALGDWCWIVVTDEQGRLHDLASAHRDPARRDELERYVESMVTVMTDAAGARVVTRTGQPLVLPEIDRERIAAALSDPEAQESLTRLGAASGAIVPLVARGQTLGALGLFTGKERGPHTQGEIDTAVEIGRRAGLALHHARLYGQQRDLADALQRSMLTAPPEPNHCEIAVRYVPAAEGAEIGGDWYDAFLQEDGGTVLAIGDVAGHDTRAAAAMGQVRGLLRGIGYSSGGTPAQILTELDRAIQGLALDTMATALVGRLEESDEDLRAGRTWFRWSSAGHPAPILMDADGEVVLLDGTPADLLLGVAPSTHREDRVVCLTRGQHRPALHRRAGGAPRPGRRRRHGGAHRRCCASTQVCRSRSCATGCSSGCSCPMPRTTSPSSPSGCTRRASPARPSRGRRSFRRASSRLRTCTRRPRPSPESQSVARRPRRRPSRVRVRAGRSTATGASQPRHTDSTRRPATSTMTEAATGSGSRPAGPASTVSATAPISAATALYGPGWTMSARCARSTSRMSAPPTAVSVPMNTTDALGSPSSCAFCAPMTVKKPSVTASRTTSSVVRRESQPEKKNVTAAVIATVGR